MQKMTGKASAPLARDNAPVTVFAHESKAPTGADTVTAKPAPTARTQRPSTSTATPATGTPAATKARQAAPATASKPEPKPVAPKGKALEAVVAKQTDSPHTGNIAGFAIYVRQREQVGQSRADAVDAVLALYKELTLGLLAEWDKTPDGDIRRDVLERYVAANLPNAHTRGSEKE